MRSHLAIRNILLVKNTRKNRTSEFFTFFTSSLLCDLCAIRIAKQGRIHGRQMRPRRHVLTRHFPRRSSFFTPFPAPFVTSYHFPSPSPTPGGLDSRKDAFLRIRKKRVMDGRTDGQTLLLRCEDASKNICNIADSFTLLLTLN